MKNSPVVCFLLKYPLEFHVNRFWASSSKFDATSRSDNQGFCDSIHAKSVIAEGIFRLHKVASHTEMHFVPFIPHTWSNGIGLGANLQLACALPNCSWFEFPIDPPAWNIEARDFMLDEPFNINTDGNIRESGRYGLGVSLDEKAVQKYSIHFWISEKVS